MSRSSEVSRASIPSSANVWKGFRQMFVFCTFQFHRFFELKSLFVRKRSLRIEVISKRILQMICNAKQVTFLISACWLYQLRTTISVIKSCIENPRIHSGGICSSTYEFNYTKLGPLPWFQLVEYKCKYLSSDIGRSRKFQSLQTYQPQVLFWNQFGHPTRETVYGYLFSLPTIQNFD